MHESTEVSFMRALREINRAGCTINYAQGA